MAEGRGPRGKVEGFAFASGKEVERDVEEGVHGLMEGGIASVS